MFVSILWDVSHFGHLQFSRKFSKQKKCQFQFKPTTLSQGRCKWWFVTYYLPSLLIRFLRQISKKQNRWKSCFYFIKQNPLRSQSHKECSECCTSKIYDLDHKNKITVPQIYFHIFSWIFIHEITWGHYIFCRDLQKLFIMEQNYSI